MSAPEIVAAMAFDETRRPGASLLLTPKLLTDLLITFYARQQFPEAARRPADRQS